jgi:pyruvate formate lyase activating enzyme
MRVFDIVKCSLVDFPGKVAAVLFVRGCQFRCVYCYNAHILTDGPTKYSEEEVFSFLKRRVNKVEGVVLCGGEPTMQPDLLDFLRKLREYPFSIKLDTNGYRPDVLKACIAKKLVDFVAMDIKAPKNKYEKITQVPYVDAKIQTSIDTIKNSGLPHQFRTTWDRRYLTEADITTMRTWLQDDANYITQECLLNL